MALNYGVFRSKHFNKTATYYMFFDVGSGSTTASVVCKCHFHLRSKIAIDKWDEF